MKVGRAAKRRRSAAANYKFAMPTDNLIGNRNGVRDDESAGLSF
jgi:hypothetical protein